MRHKMQACLLAAAACVSVCFGCRQDPPPPSYNYNLADAGARPLLPAPEPAHDPDIRGPVRRVDREARAASGVEGVPVVGGPTVAPGDQEVLAPILRFNELTAQGEYDQIPELVIPEQREQSLQYWQAFWEMVLALNDAVEAATETAGSSQPELMPRIESVRSRIEAVTARKLVVRAVRVAGEEADVAVEPPPVRCLTAPDVAELSLRRVEGQWLIVIRRLPDEAGLAEWLGELEAIVETADEAMSQFEDAEINLEGLIGRLEELVARIQTGVAPPGATQPAETAPPPGDQPPEQPPAPPSGDVAEGIS